MSLGTNISRLRAEKHLSQGDLAEALDVSRQSVSLYVYLFSVPDLDKLVKLSQVFDVSLDELVTGAAPSAEEAPPREAGTPPPQAVASGRLPGRKIAGIVLFCMAFLTFLVLTAVGGGFGGSDPGHALSGVRHSSASRPGGGRASGAPGQCI